MRYIIFYAALLVSFQASAWVKSVDFESGTVGSKADGSGGLTTAFSRTLYTKDKVRSGKQAAVSSIKKGETGFSKWGGLVRFPAKLAEGDEIWFRVWIYYPLGFSTSNNGIGVKTMRIHTRPAAGGNDGYMDLLTSGSYGINVWNEPNGKAFKANNPKWKQLGSEIVRGQWHAFEQYVKFSSKSGKGIYRAWVNGKLAFEDTKTPTLRSSTSQADFAYIWSYYNGGAPKDQKAYIDDIIVTNEKPNTVDSKGNRFIGIGSSSFTSPPKPPTPQ